MKGLVYYNGTEAGIIERTRDDQYVFEYNSAYLNDAGKPPVSLTLSKKQKVHISPTLFPFFYGLLTEGVNKDIQCRLLRIDENDDFARLLYTAGSDPIGAITVKPIAS